MPGRIQIQEVLSQTYDRYMFVDKVLGDVFDGRLTAYSPGVPQTNLTETERQLLQSVEHYADLLLDDQTEVRCLEIRLQPQVRIEQSKVGIQQYVRKLLTAGQAVLISFVPTDASGKPDANRPWRLTLVAKDTALVDGYVKDRPTNAKRYTYLLGPGQACRTAAERLDLLWKQPSISFSTLVQAFEVEALSKAFFKEYKRHYEAVTNYLDKSNFKRSVFSNDDTGKNVRDFAKKLLGRIVFLYFVQKKGWLGASSLQYVDGNPDFLMTLFNEAGKNDAFYPNWLSPLFFNTLNEKIKRPTEDFTMPSGQIVKVPFLNGGLFDRGEYDQEDIILTIPARLFHYEQNPDDPAQRGFLDFLNSYNFTIYEDSPDDQTVAVDPEMLGHIFENLLEENRSKGAIYTPKAIVHFMCQQSLVEFLTVRLGPSVSPYIRQLIMEKRVDGLPIDFLNVVDGQLDDLRICDPAIGSGAFPMGLLQEIFAIKEIINFAKGYKSWSPALVKTHIIQRSIYGVDLDAGAVDIARLRFWLALVVDEDKPKALPNLDYKIMQGNSLLESFEDVHLDKIASQTSDAVDEQPLMLGKQNQLEIGVDFSKMRQTTLLFNQEQQDELFRLIDAFYAETDPAQKRVKKARINELIDRGIRTELTKDLAVLNKRIKANEKVFQQQLGPSYASLIKATNKDWKKHLSLLAQQAEYHTKENRLLKYQHGEDRPFFLWHTYFREVFTKHGGFDIVIANPPYMRVQEVEKVQPREKTQYEVATQAYDLANLFVELAVKQLSNEQCVNCFIFPHKFFNADSSAAFREFLLDGKYIDKIAHFGANRVFNDADTYVCIALFSKTPNEGFRIQKFPFGVDVQPLLTDESRYRFVPYSQLKKASDKYDGNQWIFFRAEDEYEAFDKLYASKRLFRDHFEIFVGLQTSNDDLYLLEITSKDEQYYYGQNGLSEQRWQVEKTWFKPLLRGRQVQRYAPLRTNTYVFFPYDVDGDRYEVVTLDRLKRESPFTYRFVMEQADVFKARERGKAGRDMANWHAYIYPKNITKFEQPRLSSMEICTAHPNVTLNDGDFYHSTTVYSWVKRADVSESYEYLLAIANSSLLWWFLKNTGDTLQGDARRLKSNYLNPFPLPRKVGISTEQVVATLVRYLLYLRDPANDPVHPSLSNMAVANFLRQVVDGCVCELYFGDEMRQKSIDILSFVERDTKSLEDLSANQHGLIICRVFENWQTPNSEVRNRLKLFGTRSPDLLAYVLNP